MKLFLLCITLFLLFSHVESINYPNIDAYQLLTNVQNAIRNKNIMVFDDLMTFDLARILDDLVDTFILDKIPVSKIFGVENVHMDKSGKATFSAKIGDSTVNFKAEYINSTDIEGYLLTGDFKSIEMMIDKVESVKQMRSQREYDAMNLLLSVREAIRVKHMSEIDGFREDLFNPEAIFVSCEDRSRKKNLETMIRDLEKIPMKFIPVHENIEITHLTYFGNSMTFNVTIGPRRNIQYTAKYGPDFYMWTLSPDSCSDFYPDFVNTDEMGEPIARSIIKRLQKSLRLLNPRTLRDLVQHPLTESGCVGMGTTKYRAPKYLQKYVEFKDSYEIWDNFTITNVVFNSNHGSLKFDANVNNVARNSYEVVRAGTGEYRISTITHRKCLDFSEPKLEESEESKDYIMWMGIADDLLGRYLHCQRVGSCERSELFTSPYRLSNNQTIEYKDSSYYAYQEHLDYYVVDVKYHSSNGLLSFRVKQPNSTAGLEFEVAHGIFKGRKLASEKLIEFDFLE